MGMAPISDDVIEKEADDDTTSAGHLMLQQQRQVLYYLRLIEHEMPKLVGECTQPRFTISRCA